MSRRVNLRAILQDPVQRKELLDGARRFILAMEDIMPTIKCSTCVYYQFPLEYLTPTHNDDDDTIKTWVRCAEGNTVHNKTMVCPKYEAA